MFSAVSGIVGLPVMCAATVRSVTHVASLTVFQKNQAPGEKPKLDGVLEQRMTGVAVHILIGMQHEIISNKRESRPLD